MLAEQDGGTLGPPGPTPRRAYWPVALLLGGLVLAILGAAFVLDQRLRPSVGVEPAPAIALPTRPAAAAPTVMNAPAVSLQPTVAPTVVPTPSAVPTTQPSPVATTDAQPAAAAVVSPPPKSAAELLTPLHKEIIDGYLRYWDARMRAYYYLDTAPLSEAMAGDELERERQGVEELRGQGRAAKWDVDHNFRIVKANQDEAEVYDEYVNHSVFVDAVTKQEIPAQDPPPVRKITFYMKRIDGKWKVIDGARHG